MGDRYARVVRRVRSPGGVDDYERQYSYEPAEDGEFVRRGDSFQHEDGTERRHARRVDDDLGLRWIENPSLHGPGGPRLFNDAARRAAERHRARGNPGESDRWDYEGGLPPDGDLDEDAEVLRRSSAADLRHIELVARKIAVGWEQGYPVDNVAAFLPEVGTVTWRDLATITVGRSTSRGAVPERYVREVFEQAALIDADRFIENPSSTGKYLVLIVNSDLSDTYAVPFEGDVPDAIGRAMAIALPDAGDAVRYVVIAARDEGDARLGPARGHNPNVGIVVPPEYRRQQNPQTFYEWPANYLAGQVQKGSGVWHLVPVTATRTANVKALCGKTCRHVQDPETIPYAGRGTTEPNGVNVCTGCSIVFGIRS